MRFQYWCLAALVSASCVVPDVEVVRDPKGDASGGDASSSAGEGNSSGGKVGSSGGKGSSPDPSAGSPGEGGAPDDGPGPGQGGAPDQGGSGGGGSATAGTGSTPPGGAANGKFCNQITVDGEPVTLTLSIGTGSERLLLSAASGECLPVSGRACGPIPTGAGIPVTLLAGSEPIVTYPANIDDGESWLFVAYTDDGVTVDIVGEPVTEEVCRLDANAPTPPGDGL